ncbi:putative non-heme dioxygenase domain, isopenicillin N synthase [Helianthus annuus]|nr:putative non-heme dioxygenase domain, isopenicillin N synthase [Helianthus annuus]
MAPSVSMIHSDSTPQNIMDFVVNKGHGVKGLAELGLKTLPQQYIQPPHERFDSSDYEEQPNNDTIPVIDMSNWDDPKVAEADVKDATRQFFGLPAEEKQKYSKQRSVTNNVRFGTSFTPEAEKALEWKDYLSLFFASDDEAASLWPLVCR